MAVLLAAASCSVGDPEPRPLGIEVRNPTTLVLTTECAHDVTATVEELADSVRIDPTAGQTIDGDCASSVEIVLSAPLGDRTVSVAGDEWDRVDPSCPYGELGPGSDGAVALPECQ